VAPATGGKVALGAGLVFSVIGGLFGTFVLITAAPSLAEMALKFSSFEYFWLVLLGLTCAIFIASGDPLKGFVSLFLSLLIASVGMSNPSGYPRFTFDNPDLLGGLSLVPIMVGMFAVSEVLRNAITASQKIQPVQSKIGNVFKGMWDLLVKYPMSVLRGSILGTIVGALPGAGAGHCRLYVLRNEQEILQDAGKIRHRPRRRHCRIRRGPVTRRPRARGDPICVISQHIAQKLGPRFRENDGF
jgi:TctA family transporter